MAGDGTVVMLGAFRVIYARGAFGGYGDAGFVAGTTAAGRGADGAVYLAEFTKGGNLPTVVHRSDDSAFWSTRRPPCRPEELPNCSADAGVTVSAELAGPDAATWLLTNQGMARLGTDSTAQYELFPAGLTFERWDDAALGADNAFWIVGSAQGTILREAADGTTTSFAVGGSPASIAAGSDGALWFTDTTAGRIARITTSGTVSTVVAKVNGGLTAADRITGGGDGALWFTEGAANKLARLTTGGTLTEFDVPSQGSAPAALTVAPDGSLWFLELNGSLLVHATLPTASSTVRF